MTEVDAQSLQVRVKELEQRVQEVEQENEKLGRAVRVALTNADAAGALWDSYRERFAAGTKA